MRLYLIHRAFAAYLLAVHAIAAMETARPNIVIFIADDLSWHDVACFGGPTAAKTPHLDQLARDGVRLTGFYSSAAVCAPTRQALLTGMYPVRTGAYPNHSEVAAGTRSLPLYLRDLGYRTVCVGKTHFGPAASFPFDRMIPMLGEGEKDKEEGTGGGGEEAGDGAPDASAIERFMAEDPAKPFCLYIATHEPHGPWTKGDRSVYSPANVKMAPYLVDTKETRKDLAKYYAEVSLMDAQVGEVMSLVERKGYTANTLFLFFSEQGSSMPHGKWTLYDPGIRVSAIARWPGKIAPGSSNPALVQYEDITPTLIEAAGGNPGMMDTGCPDADGRRGFDGRSILGVLTGGTEHHRDYVFAQHTGCGINHGPKAYGSRSVRDSCWKLIVNLEPENEFRNAISDGSVLKSWRQKGEEGDAFAREQAALYIKRPAWELFDLEKDPWELSNVASMPENKAVIERLRTQLDAWMKQQGDQGDATERSAKEHQSPAHRNKNAKP